MKIKKSSLKRIKESIEQKTKAALAELRAQKAADEQKKKEASAARKAKAKTPAERKPKKTPARKKKSNEIEDRLELLFLIVNRTKAEYYVDLLESFEINMQIIAHGKGTATANMLEIFGLNDADKAVILGVIRKTKIPDALATIEQKFNTIKNGKGIAYTVPLTGVVGTLIFGFLSNNRKTVKENAEEAKK